MEGHAGISPMGMTVAVKLGKALPAFPGTTPGQRQWALREPVSSPAIPLHLQRRRWMNQRSEVQQRRLDTLCEGVEEALNEGHGVEAAKVAVLKMGKQSSLAALARELKLDRPHLSLCLRLKRNAASVRRALEFNLALPAGGMERVLEILEEGMNAQTEA